VVVGGDDLDGLSGRDRSHAAWVRPSVQQAGTSVVRPGDVLRALAGGVDVRRVIRAAGDPVVRSAHRGGSDGVARPALRLRMCLPGPAGRGVDVGQRRSAYRSGEPVAVARGRFPRLADDPVGRGARRVGGGAERADVDPRGGDQLDSRLCRGGVALRQRIRVVRPDTRVGDRGAVAGRLGGVSVGRDQGLDPGPLCS
jgi:hypothetical protein